MPRSRRRRASSASIWSSDGTNKPYKLQDPRAGLRASAGDGFPLPRPHAGRRLGDPRLARHRVRGGRPLMMPSAALADRPSSQPEASFAFTRGESAAWAEEADRAEYPQAAQQSAVIPLLWRAQEQGRLAAADGDRACRRDARHGAHPRARGRDLLHHVPAAPVGKKAHVQVCGTTPCMLRGAERLIEVCRERIHHEPLHVSADGNFSWEEVECLGACVNAPMVQIWQRHLRGPDAGELREDARRLRRRQARRSPARRSTGSSPRRSAARPR